MKAIILSVRPEWLAKILKGEKTIEIRKSVPKYFKGWVYLYCTKGKPFLLKRDFCVLNGKVVARFWFDEYTEFERLRNNPEINRMGCITLDEIISYGEFRKTLYAWHIKKLEVFDVCNEPLINAPQSWCYVEVKEVIENERIS